MGLKFTLPYIVSRASIDDASAILRVIAKSVNMVRMIEYVSSALNYILK